MYRGIVTHKAAQHKLSRKPSFAISMSQRLCEAWETKNEHHCDGTSVVIVRKTYHNSPQTDDIILVYEHMMNATCAV